LKEKLLRRLGGWENPDTVLRYTKWVKFEDRLRLYRRIRALLSTMYTVFKGFSNGKVVVFPFLNYSGFASFYFKFAAALLAPPAFNPYFGPSSRLSV